MDSPNKRNEHKWGWSQHLFNNGLLDVAVAVGRKGGCSSWHLHQHKSNTFIVREGIVIIRSRDVDDWEEFCVHLRAGDGYTVLPGVLHRMEFQEDARLYEVYVADPGKTVDLADIVRLSVGTEPEEAACVSQPS